MLNPLRSTCAKSRARLLARLPALLPAAVLLLTAGSAMAEDKIDTGDTAWMLTSSLLVLLMTLPGLALFYGGLVRTKNLLSVLMQCIFSAALIGVLWVVLGYSLAFGEGNKFIGDLSMVGLSGISVDSVSGTIPTYVFVMFQGMFAIITPALMLGAFAERLRFSAYVVFITVWVFVVYIPLAHMVWGGGWIGADLGALDFAGGLVVHMSSGFSALVAAIFVGKRMGYGKEPMAPNSLPLTVIGASLLWVGWFGFNAGSELAADGTAALAFITTQTAAATATGLVLADFAAAEGVTQGAQIMKQIISIGFTAVYACGITIAILFVMKLVMGDLRVSQEDESQGLDLSEHSETAYGLG